MDFPAFRACDIINATAGQHKNVLLLDTTDGWIEPNFKDGTKAKARKAGAAKKAKTAKKARPTKNRNRKSIDTAVPPVSCK